MLCGVFRNVEISSCVCSVLRCGRTKAERASLHSFVVGSCSPSAARRTPLVKQEKNLKRSNGEGGGVGNEKRVVLLYKELLMKKSITLISLVMKLICVCFTRPYM